MAVFYRGPCVRITGRTFETWCPQHRVFAIRELSYVHIAEPLPARATPTVMASSGFAGIITVVLSTRWLDVPAPLGLLLLVAILLTVGRACLRVHTGAYELRAVYRGQMVSLFGSSDVREFGQVRRALMRAIENVTDA